MARFYCRTKVQGFLAIFAIVGWPITCDKAAQHTGFGLSQLCPAGTTNLQRNWGYVHTVRTQEVCMEQAIPKVKIRVCSLLFERRECKGVEVAYAAKGQSWVLPKTDRQEVTF